MAGRVQGHPRGDGIDRDLLEPRVLRAGGVRGLRGDQVRRRARQERPGPQDRRRLRLARRAAGMRPDTEGLRGSYIPAQNIAELRDLTRYRHKLVGSRTSEIQRLQKTLEDGRVDSGDVLVNAL